MTVAHDASPNDDLPAGACPDAERLAAWVAGELLPAESAPVIDHLAECAACRNIAFTLRGESAPVSAPGSDVRLVGSKTRSRVLVALAAGVVVAIGTFLALRRGNDAPHTIADALAALRREHPDLYDGVSPVDPASIAAPPEATRGAVRLQTPVGLVSRTGPVVLRWTAFPGARSYRVELRGDDGVEFGGATVDAATWTFDPARVPSGARIRVGIRAEGPTGTPKSSGEIRFATDADDGWRTKILAAARGTDALGGGWARAAAVHALAGRGFVSDALALGREASADERRDTRLALLLDALARRIEGDSRPR